MKPWTQKTVLEKLITIALFTGITIGVGYLAFAISKYYSSKSVDIDNTIGHVFSIDLSAAVTPIEVTPGAEQTVNPTMTNTGTEEMYVFIRFDVGTYSTSTSTLPIYSFVVNSEDSMGGAWTAVATDNPSELLFAYCSDNELIPVQPGEAVTLPGKLVATSDNTVFSGLSDSDMKVKVTGCAIGTDNESLIPSEAYADYISLGGE